MNKLKEKPKTFDEAVEYAYKSPDKAVEIETLLGPVVLRIILPKENNVLSAKEDSIQGNNNWVEQFANAGLLEGDTREGFISRIKKLRKNSPILNFVSS